MHTAMPTRQGVQAASTPVHLPSSRRHGRAHLPGHLLHRKGALTPQCPVNHAPCRSSHRDSLSIHAPSLLIDPSVLLTCLTDLFSSVLFAPRASCPRNHHHPNEYTFTCHLPSRVLFDAPGRAPSLLSYHLLGVPNGPLLPPRCTQLVRPQRE